LIYGNSGLVNGIDNRDGDKLVREHSFCASLVRFQSCLTSINEIIVVCSQHLFLGGY